jgi:WD40 repeat protein
MMSIRRTALIAAGLGLLTCASVRGASQAAQQTSAPAPATSSAVPPATPLAKTAPDFARDVLPIIETNCLRCHSAAAQKGGLVMDTHEDLMQGGENGAVLTPGNSQTSRLIKMVQGEVKPVMPEKGARLRPEDIATFKAWIDAGAKDSATPTLSLEERIPSVPSEVSLLPAVNALAFSPDGSELAVPGYRQVRRLGIPPSPMRNSLAGAIDLVRGIAYSKDGKWIAGAGGIPGAVGEVLLWNAVTGELAHTLKGHRDYVYQADFNHRSTRLATCSYDKTIRVWDVENGRPTHVFREHTEAVFAAVFSPDDKWLASGSGDRSVKIWDLASGTRLYTLSDSTDIVQTLAFAPSGRQLSAAGNDKTIRTWDLTPQGGKQVRALLAHNAPILHIAYSPDGKMLASTASDRTVKIWNTATGAEVRTLEQQSDWSQALAWSPDGARLAVGRYDGTVSIYDVASGRRVTDPIAAPSPLVSHKSDLHPKRAARQ